MFEAIKQLITKRPHCKEIPLAHHEYAEYAYPPNHTYKITNKNLLAKRKLASRYKHIVKWYPENFESLLDIGCSKGYFNFLAANSNHCKRSVGIDVVKSNIDHCQVVKNYLDSEKTAFFLMKLHEFAESIAKFGGAFQVVLVINLYQYLYFGSDYSTTPYLDNDKIFQYLHTICGERLIFNNRVTVRDAQNKSYILYGGEQANHYTEEKIMEAASKYFVIINKSKLGRYPLWVFDKK